MASHTARSPHHDVPLNLGPTSTRLLTLKRGKFEDPVSCRLQAVDVAVAHEYEALSYVWGDENVTVPIRLNGYYFPATTNLVSALRHIRQKDCDRILWVDALCINQKSNEEKAEQVSRMTAIYGKARRVLIWLGETNDEDEVSDAVKFPTKVVGASHEGPLTDDTLASFCQHNRRELRRYENCITRLLDSDWFYRLWVLQEVAKGQDVIVHKGTVSFPWSILVDGIAALRSIESNDHNQFNRGRNFRRKLKSATFCHLFEQEISDWILFQAVSLPDRLAALLLLSNGLECKNPRDHLYALRGLAGTLEELDAEQSLRIDYDLEVREVLKKAAIYLLRCRKNLDIFYGVNDYSPIRQEIPSWVPTWDGHLYGHLRHYFDNPISTITNTTVDEPAEFIFSEDDNVLSLRAKPLGIIQKVGHPMPAAAFKVDPELDKFTSNLKPVLEEWENLCLERGLERGMKPSDLLYSWHFTLFHHEDHHPKHHQWEDACYSILQGRGTVPKDLNEEEMRQLDYDVFLGLLPLADLTCQRGKIPFATDGPLGSDFGLSDSVSPEPGDAVCAFKGSTVPYIIRPETKGVYERFHLLGPCYVHNFVDDFEFRLHRRLHNVKLEYNSWITLV